MTGTDNEFRGALPFTDEQALAEAVRLLEQTSLAARLTFVLGSRMEAAGALLPQSARALVSSAAEGALMAALGAAIRTLPQKTGPARRRMHKSLAAASGAAGGAFGLAALPVELPVSTTLIMRSIADIARAEGEDLRDPAVVLSCFEVFALGGRRPEDDYMDSGYFAVRAVLAQTVSDAASFVAHHGLAKDSAPVVVRLISEIAARFGISVSQKLAAQAVPVVGALGGAGINYAFMDHFQGIAHGHFTVRRLERQHGKDLVRAEFERLTKIWRAFQEGRKGNTPGNEEAEGTYRSGAAAGEHA